MVTINQEFDRLAQSVKETLATHRQELQLEREQIKCLTQLLSSSVSFSLDDHCIGAINRLTDLLEHHRQAADRVYNILNTLTQAKDAQDLTIDSQGEIATYLKLELGELAQRLGIERSIKLTKAAHNKTDWAKLMTAHPDPDGYQWQFPGFKGGFYHKTHLQVIGTKTAKLVPTSAKDSQN
jgi:hypothetical protein